MKTFKFLAVAGLGVVLAGTAFAQSDVVISTPAQRVLQLSQAKVADSTIIAYLQANPGDYRLSASGIIYLKQQGVSDQVLTIMLNQSTAVQTAQAQAPAQPAATYSQPAPSVVPTVVYAQSAPAVVYASPAPVYYPDYSYPSYSYGAAFPISLSFGWYGGGYYGGSYYYGRNCFYNGYHGGYSGGYHGGSWSGYHGGGSSGYHGGGGSGGFHGGGGAHH
jgi:hypothetical protein